MICEFRISDMWPDSEAEGEVNSVFIYYRTIGNNTSEESKAFILSCCLAIISIFFFSVDQAGSERTEAGESAPSRLEDSPRPGRAKCELCETLQDLIMGAGEEASLNLPCLLILASS